MSSAESSGGPRIVVDIICAVLSGARHLPDFLRSLDAQTHADWRLWLRDDGSTDGSVAILRAKAAADPRVVLLHAGGPPRGAARAFNWLLERVPATASHVMCADQDDVWLPEKIARTLAAMRTAEGSAPGGTPILVHTDLTVVDEELNVVHPSFWDLAQMDPRDVGLRRLTARNVTTGNTMMLNRALVDRIGHAPDAAIFHDWWYALVAAAFGRIISIDEATVLYRQHGTNAVGARDMRITMSDIPGVIRQGFAKTRDLRAGVALTASQASAFLDRYASDLSPADRAFLHAYASIPKQNGIQRKLSLLRLRAPAEPGLFRRLGVLLRG